METQVIAFMLYYKHAVLCLTHVKLKSASSPLQLWLSEVGASLSLKPLGAGTVGANPLRNCSVGCFPFCMRFQSVLVGEGTPPLLWRIPPRTVPFPFERYAFPSRCDCSPVTSGAQVRINIPTMTPKPSSSRER
ncbi:unnamed protein product [Boreogadus saida]